MADSQVPWGLQALRRDGQRTSVEDQAELVPSGHRRPDDPSCRAAKRANATIVEVKGSHAIHVSQPGAVAALIEQAANSVKIAGAYAPAAATAVTSNRKAVEQAAS